MSDSWVGFDKCIWHILTIIVSYKACICFSALKSPVFHLSSFLPLTPSPWQPLIFFLSPWFCFPRMSYVRVMCIFFLSPWFCLPRMSYVGVMRVRSSQGGFFHLFPVSVLLLTTVFLTCDNLPCPTSAKGSFSQKTFSEQIWTQILIVPSRKSI